MDPIELDGLARVEGTVRVPGDKSIGHRSLLFGAVGLGATVVRGLPQGGDVRTTLAAVRALGIEVHEQDGVTRVEGRGWSGIDGAPGPGHEVALDCGNSGTTTRLLLGLLAARRGDFRLHGDPSLSGRPMGRVVRPLRALGATIEAGAGPETTPRDAGPLLGASAGGAREDRLPLRILGGPLRGAEIATGVASAQVKSAAILAALQADGDSVVAEPAPTRDHTERMLLAMGAPLVRAGELVWRVTGGQAPLGPLELEIPGDPSSAAFLVAVAAVRPGSVLRIERVGLNPRRIGFLRLLKAMGADLRWEVEGEQPDPWGAIEVRGSALRGIEIGGADVVDAIDELPVLAVVAATAEGPTTLRGAGELRVKESDRIASTAALLRAFGAGCDELPDGLVVHGSARLRGAAFDAGVDHRIAMAAAVAACGASGRSRIGGHEWVAVSYPSFYDDLREIGRR